MDCVEVKDLGTMDYGECWALQRRIFDSLLAAKREERTADTAGTILLVEHPPVYTLGKNGHRENMLGGEERLKALGAGFYHIDRGGDITFHGPGQLVCYPILDLERTGTGLKEYIDALEEAVIRTVARWGIRGGRIAGASGVWIMEEGRPPRKICAIGVHASRFITMHGLALNITTDLAWFNHINPCGFVDRGVTSVARESAGAADAAKLMEEAKGLLADNLTEILNVKIYKKQ